MRSRHVPVRTCIVCGRKSDKRELLRVVAGSDSSVIVDPTGKAQGRGAYVCRDDAAIPQNVKRGKIEYALRAKISDND